MNKRFIYVAVALGLVIILAAVLWQESQSIFNSKIEPTSSPIPSATLTISPTPAPTVSPKPEGYNKTATATFDIPSKQLCANLLFEQDFDG